MRLIPFLMACLCIGAVSVHGDDVAKPKPTIEMAEGLSPQEAAKRMTVPEGFRVSFAAGEPLVHQPIAFAIDHRGRLWIAEAYTYPNRAEDGHGKDKIVILEDRDHDGSFETRKVFIEGLNLVSGLELGFGGVWVGAAPYLMFIPDRDEDDIPDAPDSSASKQRVKFPKDVPAAATVLLDGFGWQDTHETLNSFIWGPDGWLYGCHGVFTHSRVGPPETIDADRQPLNAGVWRFHPTRHTFEVFAHGTSNPWGVDFNEQGQAFITACVIPHLWHMIQGGRYHRQGGQHFNPYTFDDIKTIADHAHYVGKVSDHAWWGHEPKAPADTLAAGGGHAHCGAMIYLGDNWPAKYRNQIFMHNVHGNRINECLLERSGSGYIGCRAPDTLIANDHWFRGINLKYGPDGSVYLIDWYDKNACHRTNTEIWDRTNGRVYNLRYQDRAAKPSAKVTESLARLRTGKPDDLIQLLDHPNEWFARMTRRRLHERAHLRRQGRKAAGDAEATDPITKALHARFELATTIPDKLRFLWTMHSVSDVDSEMLIKLLEASGPDSEYLRAWAIQLELEDRIVSDDFLKKMITLAKSDPSPVVLMYLASAMQRLTLEQRWMLAFALVSRGEIADDHNLPLLIWYGVEPLVQSNSNRSILLAKSSKIGLVARYVVRRASVGQESMNAVVEWLSQTTATDTQNLILDELVLAFNQGMANPLQPTAWTAAYDTLSQSNDLSVREKTDRIAVAFGDRRILPRMKAIVHDRNASAEQRQKAFDLIVKSREPSMAPVVLAALDDPALRSAAIKALIAFDSDQTSSAIISRYGSFYESEKRDAINTLVIRPAFANALFDAVENGTIARTDVHAYHVQQLLGFNDALLTKRVKAVWGDVRATPKEKQEAIARYKAELTPSKLRRADLSNGRRLFSKTCAACHQLFGEGGKIGPDITGSNRANLDYLLENILDPSAIVGKDYQTTLVHTTDGRVITGLLQKTTENAVVLRTISDTVVIPKSDIDEITPSNLSIMPEGQFNQLTPDEQRDLIAYLGTPNQVALRGPKSPIDSQTGRVSNALEGESMKIVGKTDGNVSSQPMSGFDKDKWSAANQLWWTGAKPGSQLELELPVAADALYDVEVVMTMARDYGIVQLSIDGQPLGTPIDCYDTEVVTTGVLSVGEKKLTAGRHVLGLKIIGANPKAIPAYMAGIDYVRLLKRH